MEYGDVAAAVEPDAVRAALAAHAEQIGGAGHAHGADLLSVRQAVYRGHEVVVRSSYEITVDGRPFDVHLTVDNNGRVHYHGLPTRDFASVISLVEKVIDTFPGDFTGPPSTDSDHHHVGDDNHVGGGGHGGDHGHGGVGGHDGPDDGHGDGVAGGVEGGGDRGRRAKQRGHR